MHCAFVEQKQLKIHSMKKFIVIAIMMTLLSMQGAFAQSLEGYKEVNLKEEFTDNAFTFFSRAPILLSGDKTEHNAMTIGWGSLGNYLGYNRLTVSVYVAPERYTY